jgi:hypothetical protein
MVPIDGYSLDMPGLSRDFAPSGEDAIEGVSSIEPVCRALEALAPVVRPLSIDILLHAFRRDGEEAPPLPRPFWYAVEAEAETALGLEPSTGGGPTIRRVDLLTPQAVRGVMAEAVAANPAGADMVVTWSEIRIFATEVRLPEALATRDVLSIGPEGYSFGVPVRRRSDGAWVRGPLSTGDLPPMRIFFAAPFVTARIVTYWSIWTPQGQGGLDFERAVMALDAAGWKLSA